MSRRPDSEHEAERVRRAYDRYAASRRRQRAWAADNPGNRAIRAELLEALLEEAGPELRSGGELLDVGCGGGFWLEALRDAGVAPERLTGVDLLPARVSAASARVPGATVRLADARALPFDDGRFALVLAFTLLSSLASAEDVRRAATEARRVLRPGGLLLVYEPRLPNPLNRRVRRISAHALEQAGMRPVSDLALTVLPPVARRLGSRTPALYPRLSRLPPLRSHRLVTLRRN